MILIAVMEPIFDDWRDHVLGGIVYGVARTVRIFMIAIGLYTMLQYLRWAVTLILLGIYYTVNPNIEYILVQMRNGFVGAAIVLICLLARYILPLWLWTHSH